MSRQQRGVNVERHPSGHLQDLARDELAIGGEQQAIRREVADHRAAFVGTQPIRGCEVELARARRLGDRRGSRLQTSSRRTVRGRDDQQLVGELGEAAKQRNGKRPGSEKGEAADARH